MGIHRHKLRQLLGWTALRQRLQTSLWTLPSIAVAAAVLGVPLLVRLDRGLPQEEERWYLFGGHADSARELLSTIASSMLTFTALVFSITILVLQLASSQFSPRVIRTFLEDKMTRITLAVFVGSFVFATALLPEVKQAAEGQPAFVPALSVFIAFVLVLISVGVFIKYVHHMAHAVRAVEIAKRVGDETRASIEKLYPEGALEDAPDDGAAALGEPDQILAHDRPAGVVTHVETDGLFAVARERNVAIALIPMVGDFVARGMPLFRIWGSARLKTTDLRHFVVIAEERTLHQDASFGIRQLVDIAERALSPGVNDPTTAVQALDQIHDILRTLAARPFPRSARAEPDGRIRLVLAAPNWDAYVRLGLDEIRQYGKGSIQVMRRLRAVLEDLCSVAPPRRREVLRQQLELLERAAEESFGDPLERDAARNASVQGHGQLER